MAIDELKGVSKYGQYMEMPLPPSILHLWKIVAPSRQNSRCLHEAPFGIFSTLELKNVINKKLTVNSGTISILSFFILNELDEDYVLTVSSN